MALFLFFFFSFGPSLIPVNSCFFNFGKHLVVQALTTQGVCDAVMHALLPDGVWLLQFCLPCESSKKQFIRQEYVLLP